MNSARRFAGVSPALVLVAFAIVGFVTILAVPAIPQDLAYHSFADQRALLGISNSLNVLSNLPFLIVGLLGVKTVLSSDIGASRTAWLVLFAGVTLVSFGSAYYHHSPDSNSLLWDRLPMTIGFMGLLAALSQESFEGRVVEKLLGPAIVVGIASVMYWYVTDDLRFYALVQFMSLGFVLLLLLLYRSQYTHAGMLGLALLFYTAAKITEALDTVMFDALYGWVSGHTIKHLLAASGCYCLVIMLRSRQPKENT